ncbi:MAG: oligogalacturonide lyase, partial [Armatimonadetes bacterium]|nr:oligogalacturonide lyase [Armatimonadota bacterium]
MTVGTVTPPEWRELTDPVSGVRLRQLTSYKTNSHHLYFTNPGWYAGGRKLLFGSERYNRS